MRELITSCNGFQVDQPLHSQHPHLKPIVLQLIQSCAFILRLLRTFGAAEETIWSTPRASLPDTSILFDGSVEAKNQVKLAEYMPWISMDGCTIERMKMTVEGLSKAAHQFLQELAQVHDEKIATFVAGYMSETALIEAEMAKANGTEQLERNVWPLVAAELNRLALLRQSVRSYAQKEATGDAKKLSLMSCDRLRDQYLPTYGIRLQDRSLGSDSSQADTPAIGLINPKFYLEEEQDKKRVSLR
ncbi:hypothetical protein Ciccas_001694 [Cichlidogyrus casuarinus]|uniref:Uncharacterized protein n=1 Tax=Cichlidogyrus casuarinus TaxID=1844966 RepID=A0ABD2QJK0_9PLAT